MPKMTSGDKGGKGLGYAGKPDGRPSPERPPDVPPGMGREAPGETSKIPHPK